MEPEKDDGNIEYKLKLIDKSIERIENLATQMRYRCEEGDGECIYNIGVEDDGTIIGITKKEYQETVQILTRAAEKNKYSITPLTITPLDSNELCLYEVLIREQNENKYIDIKVAIAGPVDAGKSTFLGVLTTDKLDDGRGSARLSVFNFPHEIKTGRTSSIGHHILGFDNEGKSVNYNSINGKISWPQIVRRSAKIISLFDMCGHEKYLKTTILGLASTQPDLCLIVVGANKGIRNEQTKTGRQKKYENMTREHIFLCITLNIPFAIIVTKIDMISLQGIENVYEQTIKDIQTLVRCPGVRRQPIKVENKEDVLICAKQIHTESIVPIFPISNVSGKGIDKLKSFLNLMTKQTKQHLTTDVEYHIDSIWSVPGVGTVIGGHLLNGTINVNDKLYIGPNNGKYDQIVVRSIHCKKVPLQTVSYGSYVCLAIKKYERKLIKRGNVIVSNVSQQILTNQFIAEIKILRSHSTTIRVGYEPVIYVSTVRQTVTLLKIDNKINSRNPEKTKDDDILRTDDTALCTFSLKFQPEFIKPNMRLLMAEGRTKIIGVVKSVS